MLHAIITDRGVHNVISLRECHFFLGTLVHHCSVAIIYLHLSSLRLSTRSQVVFKKIHQRSTDLSFNHAFSNLYESDMLVNTLKNAWDAHE